MYMIKGYQRDSLGGRRGIFPEVFLAFAEIYDIVLNIFHLFNEKSEGIASQMLSIMICVANTWVCQPEN